MEVPINLPPPPPPGFGFAHAPAAARARGSNQGAENMSARKISSDWLLARAAAAAGIANKICEQVALLCRATHLQCAQSTD